jgi:hypothetical protein
LHGLLLIAFVAVASTLLLKPAAKLLCHGRELLEQFIADESSGKKVFHILMHPYTLHSLARGHTLRYFATWQLVHTAFFLN